MMNSSSLYRAGGFLFRGFGLLVLLFLALPIVAIIPLSFTAGVELVYPVPAYSLRWYEDFFTRSEWLLSFRNSMIVGFAVTILATVIGTLGALGLYRLPTKIQSFISALIILPMAIPVVVAGVAFFYFYARLGLAGSFAGLILAHTTMAVPFVVISVRAALAGLNPDLAKAAASLGAPPHRAFIRVVMPIILPGVLTGGLFAFAVSFDDVVIAMYLSGPEQVTLPRQMFAGVRENISPTVLAASTLMVAFSVVLMATTSLLTRRAQALRASPHPDV
jgi:putative spermidine/putrescine transport system permease protein